MWSFSKLGTFERCKRRFKFIYIDKIRYDSTSVEAFMGTMVHEALEILYQKVEIGKLITLKQLEDNNLINFDLFYKRLDVESNSFKYNRKYIAYIKKSYE